MIKLEARLLDIVRVWWRPCTCIGIAGGVIVHGIVMPFINNQSIDLMGFAAVITACSTAFAVRSWEKIKGSSE